MFRVGAGARCGPLQVNAEALDGAEPSLKADTVDLADLSVPELLALYAKLIEELRGRGVTRSSNNPVADYTEWLVAVRLGLTLEGNSAAGYDAVDTQGVRYQIKGRRVTPQNPSLQLSQLRRLTERPFDVLVGVVYNPDFTVLHAAAVPLDVVVTQSRYVQHTNSYRFDLRPAVLALPGVANLTEVLR